MVPEYDREEKNNWIDTKRKGLKFERQMPRDDRMYNINEGNNLIEKEDSLLQKFNWIECLPRKLTIDSIIKEQ